MQNRNYFITVPTHTLAIMKFNECQENIMSLQKHIETSITSEQRDKLNQAYNLLEEVQYWLVDNIILHSEPLKQEDISILGEVILFNDRYSLRFPSKSN